MFSSDYSNGVESFDNSCHMPSFVDAILFQLPSFLFCLKLNYNEGNILLLNLRLCNVLENP